RGKALQLGSVQDASGLLEQLLGVLEIALYHVRVLLVAEKQTQEIRCLRTIVMTKGLPEEELGRLVPNWPRMARSKGSLQLRDVWAGIAQGLGKTPEQRDEQALHQHLVDGVRRVIDRRFIISVPFEDLPHAGAYGVWDVLDGRYRAPHGPHERHRQSLQFGRHRPTEEVGPRKEPAVL